MRNIEATKQQFNDLNFGGSVVIGIDHLVTPGKEYKIKHESEVIHAKCTQWFGVQGSLKAHFVKL